VSQTLSTECQEPSYTSLTRADTALSKTTEPEAITSTYQLFLHSRSPTGRGNESELRGCPPIITDMEHDNRLVTVEELADYLGVPVATIYAWRYRREGPLGFRVGKHLRFRWRDVEEWIDHQLQDAGR
jgi:excisionase family DNA binding protein